MSRVLVLGGTSSIARALSRQLAAEGKDVTVAGRDTPELERIAADLAIRYEVDADSFHFDAEDPDGHRAALGAFLDRHAEDLQGAYWCIGYLGDASDDPPGWSATRRIMEVNLTAATSALGLLADALEDQDTEDRYLCVISSVAGDRGRSSNYTYGASKAGLSAYLEGLRQRLASHDVQVTTIKPGFVDTKMTFGQEGMFLVASPERVAKSMVRAVDRGRAVVYVPWFWRPVLFALRSIPTPIFKRLEL